MDFVVSFLIINEMEIKLFGYIQYKYNINGKLTAMAAYGQK